MKIGIGMSIENFQIVFAVCVRMHIIGKETEHYNISANSMTEYISISVTDNWSGSLCENIIKPMAKTFTVQPLLHANGLCIVVVSCSLVPVEFTEL